MKISSYKKEIESLLLSFPVNLGRLDVKMFRDCEVAILYSEQSIVAVMWVNEGSQDEIVIAAASDDIMDEVRQAFADIFVTNNRLNVTFCSLTGAAAQV